MASAGEQLIIGAGTAHQPNDNPRTVAMEADFEERRRRLAEERLGGLVRLVPYFGYVLDEAAIKAERHRLIREEELVILLALSGLETIVSFL